MNYELAKELKDAGFPQKNPRAIPKGSALLDDNGVMELPSEPVYIPTLSELIEACNPDKFDDFGFLRNLDRWEAYAFYVGYFDFPEQFKQEDGTNLVDLHCYSDSLEEAVANLWLALKQHT